MAAPSEAAFIFGWIFAFMCMLLYNYIYGNRCGLRRHPEDHDAREGSSSWDRRSTVPPVTLTAPTRSEIQMSRKDRREYVENVIRTEKFKAVAKRGLDAPTGGGEDSTLDATTTATLDAADNDDDDDNGAEIESDEMQCAVCIEKFQDGDEYCSSHNQNCLHHFHRHCIVEWLLTHDDCPCCRRDYLGFESDDNDEEDDDDDDEVDLEAGRLSAEAQRTGNRDP